MTRRTILVGLLITGLMTTVGFVLPTVRYVHWPKSQHEQDRILDEQWAERYRLSNITDPYAQFEFVP